MTTLPCLARTLPLLAALALATSCEFDKPLSYSWSIETQFDIPANWEEHYFAIGLLQDFEWRPGALSARGSIKTPQNTSMPPTSFTWTLRQYDNQLNMKAEYSLPSDVRVRRYTGKFNVKADFPGFDFVRGDQLVISGTFNGPLPTGTSLGAKIKYNF
jgi:hypothetical protein